MKRINQVKIDTPEYYEKVWSKAAQTGKFDCVRHRALISKVKDEFKVADLGAGLYGSAEFIASKTNLKCELHAVDYSYTAKEILTKRCPQIKFTLSDVTKTPYPDSYFDVVIAGETIEHIENPEDLVKEMSRICKPNGWIAISSVDPKCEDAIRNNRTYPEHLWEFEPYDFIKLFKAYGKPEYYRVGNYHVVHLQNKKPSVWIVNADDFEETKSLDCLFKIKSLNPNFKITLFTIMGKVSKDFINLIKKINWIDLAPHGYMHETPEECKNWDYNTSIKYLDFVDEFEITKIFKAPGWQISDDTYKALIDRNYAVADQIYNNERRPPQLAAYLLDTENKLHFHFNSGMENDIEKHIEKIANLKGEFKFIKEILWQN